MMPMPPPVPGYTEHVQRELAEARQRIEDLSKALEAVMGAAKKATADGAAFMRERAAALVERDIHTPGAREHLADAIRALPLPGKFEESLSAPSTVEASPKLAK
jgi:hypothetical protein